MISGTTESIISGGGSESQSTEAVDAGISSDGFDCDFLRRGS